MVTLIVYVVYVIVYVVYVESGVSSVHWKQDIQ